MHSSSESELNDIEDCISKVTWTKKFLEAHNYIIKSNVIFQDNKSTIKLMKIGKRVPANALITLTILCN